MTAPTAQLADWLDRAEAVVVGAGAGLSTSAGYEYGGERFRALFPDFSAARGFTDMYTAGFYPFPTPEEKWAYWSRMVLCNRYDPIPRPAVYADLLAILRGKDHFIVTTNVDHAFQRSGFDKTRLFYTQATTASGSAPSLATPRPTPTNRKSAKWPPASAPCASRPPSSRTAPSAAAGCR